MSAVPERENPKRRSGLRLVLLAVLAAALFAGGFAIGRATEDGEPSAPEPTAKTQGGDRRDEFPRIDVDASYDAKDVIDAFPPMIVRDGAILDQEEGTPERALLEWWQAYQFDDVETVERLTAKSTIDAIGRERLRALVNLPGPGLQGVEVLGSTGGGKAATVDGALLTFQPTESGAPPPDEPTNSQPETFAMERERGDWLFAATEFLELKLNTLPE